MQPMRQQNYSEVVFVTRLPKRRRMPRKCLAVPAICFIQLLPLFAKAIKGFFLRYAFLTTA